MFRAFVLALAMCNPVETLARVVDPITEFANYAAAMAAAQQSARGTLPLSLTHATDNYGYKVARAAVMVAFDIGNNQTEVIWAGPFAWGGDQGMIGLLANQSNFMGELDAGDQVEFNVTMVRDWSMTFPEGQVYGNYTTRVMAPLLDTETAAQLNAALSENPVPAEWQ